MRKIISIFLALVIIFSMSTMAMAASFDDVSELDPQNEAIDILTTLEIIEGYGDNNFGPNDILTRAQLCTMLVRAIYGKDAHYSVNNIFEDVPVRHWARLYIDTAYENGLMIGHGNGKFGPEENLTYTQTARTILNALGYGKFAWPEGVDTIAYELGLYSKLGRINTEDYISRGHAAQMIYNAFNLNTVKIITGQTIQTKNNFLNDILGYEEIYIIDEDNREYIAYDNDSLKEPLVTTVETGFQDVIYPAAGTGGDMGWRYSWTEEGRPATKEDIPYFFHPELEGDVCLYVNDTFIDNMTDTITWFGSAEKAIGYFDHNENLIAIEMETEGKVWVPAANVGTIPDDLRAEVVADEDFDEDTSTVTYFDESNTYLISNLVKWGKVDTVEYRYVAVEGVRYKVGANHGISIGDYVFIYLDYKYDVSAFKLGN